VYGKKHIKMQNKLKTFIYIYMYGGMLALLGFAFLLYLSVGGGVSVYIPENLNYDQKVKFYIDHIEKNGRFLSLSGWALIPDENIEIYKTHILLRNIIDEQYLKIPTIMRMREDMTEHFHDPYSEVNYNYNMSGWHARVNTDKLNLSLEQYEIVLLYQNNFRNILVYTGRHLVVEG